MDVLTVILFSYLSGSIPFGLILTKFFDDRDIRNIGSGNIGATNVLRTGNKYLAALTLLLDILKGFIAVIITQQHFSELIQLSCLLAFLGHVFPIWLKFKGGKGVATYLGVLLALSVKLGFLFMFTWLIVSLIFKYSSVSSMFSSLTVFAVTLIKETTLQSIGSTIYTEEKIKLILFIFFILIIMTHKKNISNLKNKTEHKIKI
jgi:glycerol-3-phosphate acyltransferase PlsY